jgi:hypothetical protein
VDDLAVVSSARSRVEAREGRPTPLAVRDGWVPSHPQTRTPCPPPRSSPSSPPPRRASPRAAPPGRLPARRAARSAPRRPTPSTRASRCSSTATGSSSRPVRDGRLSSLSRLARGEDTRDDRLGQSPTPRACRARSRATTPPRSRPSVGASRSSDPPDNASDARARADAPFRATERFANVPKTEKNTFALFARFCRSPQRSSTAARTTLRSSTSA